MRLLTPVLMIAGLLAAWPAVAAADPEVTPGPTLGGAPDAIVRGPDGAMWVTESANPGALERITAAGGVTRYQGGVPFGFLPANFGPSGLVAAPAGASGSLWFLVTNVTFEYANLTGDVFYPAALAYGRPTSLAGGPDGALWFTVEGDLSAQDAISRLVPPYAVTNYYTGSGATNPRLLTAGTNALWFAETGGDQRIGRVSTSGQLTWFDVGGGAANALAAGPGDALWYAQGTTVRRLGAPESYTTPSAVTALAFGPDGALWAAGTGTITRIVPGEGATTIPTGYPSAHGTALATGPDGRMWLTLDESPYLVKATVPPSAELTGGVAVSATDGTLTATVNPNGLPTTVSAELQLPDGSWQVIASASAGSGTTPTQVQLALPGLAPGATSVVRITISNAAGSVSSSAVTITTPPAPTPTATPTPTPAAPTPTPTPAIAPVQGKSAGVRVASGTVRVKVPGGKAYKELTGSATIPLGTLLDTTNGSIELTTLVDGKPQAGTFRGGQIRVSQTRDGTTELALAGAISCGTTARAAAVTKKAKPRKRLIWGKDRGGKFRTRGNSSVATVRGTEWLTQDTCKGTTIVVRSGSVSVWPRKGGRAKLVKAGQRLFTPRKK